jgi:3-oxoacyl-[acyl-carrier protein] reductase
LVTGAARNIGRATAIAFAEAGARVFATDIDAAGLARTVERIAATHGEDRIASTVADLVDPSAPASIVDQAATRFGRLDIVVHCAVDEGRGALEELTPRRWDEVQAINVRAGAFLVQAAAPYLDASEHAAVVLFSSVHAEATHPRCFAYATSKGAVDALVRGLAVEVGSRSIRVNGIRPGYVPADDHAPVSPVTLAAYPMGRVGTPEAIAATAVFLASDAASWMTGAVVDVDGGKHALSAEATGWHVYRFMERAPQWRARIKRFGGRIRR